MTTSRASFWNPFFLITFIIWCFSPAWLFCYAFCICLSTFRYQKYKSVDLGDQLVSPQPDCPNLCRRLHWCCRASSPHRPSCSCNLVSFCQQLNIHRMIFKYICNFVFNRQSMSKDFQLCSFISQYWRPPMSSGSMSGWFSQWSSLSWGEDNVSQRR